MRIRFGGGLSPEFVEDPDSQRHFTELKALLDRVNAEDRGCTEKVYRGLGSTLAVPGPLSHLERPNYDFARYLASRVAPETAPGAETAPVTGIAATAAPPPRAAAVPEPSPAPVLASASVPAAASGSRRAPAAKTPT